VRTSTLWPVEAESDLMPDALVISIDGMGGDHAPDAIVDGVEIAARRHVGTRFLIHGDDARLRPLLSTRAAAQAASTIVHSDRAVAMDAKPSQAVRQGRGTSMWNALVEVEEGRAHAAVSAGNTGALMAMAKLRLRTVEGVHRPAIVGSWPTPRGFAVVLDIGANLEADAEQLVEFAIMGEAFHRAVYGTARPTVGLLNIGSEELKGHDEIRAAAKLIREAGLDMAFKGFVEGDGISGGAADVIVTDGFTGNIALKTGEGTAKLIANFLKEALSSGPLAMLGALVAYPALKKLKDKMDPRTVNGGVFLGLNGLVVKSHGGTDGRGFAAAIDVSIRMARSHFREEVTTNLARLSAAPKVVVPAESDPS
jgi:phosphate acyltransferase